MANWDITPKWTDFNNINGGEQFSRKLTAEDLNALAQNIAYLYANKTDSAVPIEVSSETEMNALLSSGTVGGVYKYTGTTGTYENGALYVLEVDI